jgi:hypothetical protein
MPGTTQRQFFHNQRDSTKNIYKNKPTFSRTILLKKGFQKALLHFKMKVVANACWANILKLRTSFKFRRKKYSQIYY